MANTLTAIGLTQLSGAFVAGLYDGGVLAGTVWKDADAGLVAGRGDSVTIREPNQIGASQFTGTASATGITEGKYVVTLDRQPYSQVILSAREKTLGIESLATQVIVPQAAGIAEFVDEEIAAKLESTTGAVSGADWTTAVIAAREALGTSAVPQSDRFLAVAPDVAGELLATTVITQGNYPGAGAALTEGTLGRWYGFTVVESNSISAGTAVAYHRSAVAAIFRTPQAPEGGAASGSATFAGMSSQVIYGYDNTKLSDVITCHTLYGLGTSDDTFDKRAVKVSVTAGP